MKNMCNKQQRVKSLYDCDFENVRFGSLVAISRAADLKLKNGKMTPQWNMVCDCGDTLVATTRDIRRGRKTSCPTCRSLKRRKDFTGQRFGMLVVLSRNGYVIRPDGNRVSKWLCQCDCGNEVTILQQAFGEKWGHSCGCYRKRKRVRSEDMVGRKFGRLTVISRAADKYTKNGHVVNMWNCRCDCGTHTVVRGAGLRNGHTKSCGCYRLYHLGVDDDNMSKSETVVAKYLDEYNIPYVREKSFESLVGLGDGLLSFDFYIVTSSFELLIECQGEHHYKPVDFFGGEKGYLRQREHDLRKVMFANDNNISLLHIDCSKYDPVEIRNALSSHLMNLN